MKAPSPMTCSVFKLTMAVPLLLSAFAAGSAHAAENFSAATAQKLVAACQIDFPRHAKVTPEQSHAACGCVVPAMQTSQDHSGMTDANWQQVADVLTQGGSTASQNYPPQVVMTAGFYMVMMQEPEVTSCIQAATKK